MDSLSFWLPLFLLFFSALIGALMKRRSCDHCLKKFNGDQILIPHGENQWIGGKLLVFAQGIELIGKEPADFSVADVYSRIIYSSEVDKISCIVRQAPAPDTRRGMEWKKERQRLLTPPVSQRIKRSILNAYNMLRDCFGQALRAIVGVMSKDTRISKTKDAQKRLDEVQSSLSELVPNSWEPILEKYRGKHVAIEREVGTEIICESGILEDYSSKYLLLRDVQVKEVTLNERLISVEKGTTHRCDVLYARHHALLRYSLK